MRTSVLLPVFVLGMLATAAHAQQSTTIVPTVPTSVRVNQPVTLTGRLTDAWAGNGLPGRIMNISVGDRYSFSTTPFNTDGSGFARQTWRFTRPGRYRVIFQVNSGYGYLDSRATTFINVTN